MTLKNPDKLFPMFVTKDLQATKRFYTQAGFTLRFDMDHYLQVAYGGEEGPELCFMKPDAPFNEQPAPEFGGKGVIVSIPTPDADAKYKELKQLKMELLNTPEDKPWGWRSFHAVDPNGVILDFFHVYKEAPVPNASS